ncbi:MAG: phosphatase PAP2 family protein [Dehalococcoidia bacterium]|nr:phosphatase PAP2 family protein [Dehalococcoidia bacterium]
MDGDIRFMRWYQNSFNVWIWDKGMQLISIVGNELNWVIVMILTAAICAVFRKWLASLLVLSSGIAFAVNSLLKVLIHRPRPTAAQVNIIGSKDSSFSFPSGHVTTYVALFGIIFVLAEIYVKKMWLRRTLQALSMFLMLTVGLSRMTLGMHWPSDVGSGYLLGSIFLLIALPSFFFLRSRGR